MDTRAVDQHIVHHLYLSLDYPWRPRTDCHRAKGYSRYIWGGAHGDLGESFARRGRSVREIIAKRIPVSAQLGLAALIISVGLGIPLGVFAALKQGTGWDTVAVSGSLLGQSIPVFLTAPAVLIIFALKFKLLPTHGFDGFFSTSIILPALVMGIPGIAILTSEQLEQRDWPRLLLPPDMYCVMR